MLRALWQEGFEKIFTNRIKESERIERDLRPALNYVIITDQATAFSLRQIPLG